MATISDFSNIKKLQIRELFQIRGGSSAPEPGCTSSHCNQSACSSYGCTSSNCKSNSCTTLSCNLLSCRSSSEPTPDQD